MDDHLATFDPAAPSTVLAATIEAQRRILGRHFGSQQKRLKPKAVHELRVAIRRLLTALTLADALGITSEARSLRRLHKLLARLSPARDAHVQLRQLTQLLPVHPATPQLLEQLRQERRIAARRASKRLRTFARAELERDLSLVVGALHTVPGSATSSAAARAALLGQLAQRHLLVEHERHRASADDPEALHATRLALKDYRYALEALAPSLPSSARAVAHTCEELQNLLGQAHDSHVLAKTAHTLALAHGAAEPGPLVSASEALDELSRQAHVEAAAALAGTALAWLAETD